MATSIDDNVVIIVILHATAYSNPQDSRKLNSSFSTKADIRHPLCYSLINRRHFVIYQQELSSLLLQAYSLPTLPQLKDEDCLSGSISL